MAPVNVSSNNISCRAVWDIVAMANLVVYFVAHFRGCYVKIGDDFADLGHATPIRVICSPI